MTKDDARRLITDYVGHYNTVRLHSTIGYVTPADMLADGRRKSKWRDKKLETAREQRKSQPPEVRTR